MRHERLSQRVLAALAMMFIWVSAFLYGFWPVREAHVSALGPNPVPLSNRRAEPKPQAGQPAAVVPEPEQFLHEHARLTFPTQDSMNRERPQLASRSTFRPRIDDLTPTTFRPLLVQVAAEFDLDPRLLAAMIKYESNWDVYAVGPAHDSGLMQIIPSTAAWIASKMGLNHYDILDPETNLRMGAWFLRALLNEYGDLRTALVVYNAGPGVLNSDKGPDPYKYASRVLSIRDTGGYVH